MVTYPASSVLAWSGAIRNTDPKGWRKNLTPANRSEGDFPAKEDHLSPQTLRQCQSSPKEAHLPGVPYLLLISAPSGKISLTLRKEEWHSLFLSTLLSIPRPPGQKKKCVCGTDPEVRRETSFTPLSPGGRKQEALCGDGRSLLWDGLSCSPWPSPWSRIQRRKQSPCRRSHASLKSRDRKQSL